MDFEARERLRQHFGKQYHGIIREFHGGKGYGFIHPEGTVDPYLFPNGRIFYHIKSLIPKPKSNADALTTFLGRRVRFQLGLNPRNMKVYAQSVYLADPSSPTIGRSAASSSSGSLDSPLDHDLSLLDDEPLSGLMDHLAYFDMESPARQREFNTALALTDEENSLKRQAVEMGFDVAQVDRVLLAVDIRGRRKEYTDLQVLLDELITLQDADGLDALHVFDPTSDDFRVQTYLRQANNMGFPQELVLDALSGHAGGFASFEALMERIMELQAEQEAANAPTGTELEIRAARLRKENEDIRLMFSCKICMDASSAVVFVPCGHVCCCVPCASNTVRTMCPVCRQNVTEKQFLELGNLVATGDGRVGRTGLKDEVVALEAENQTLKASRLCRGCKLRDRSAYFLPCRHLVYCEICSGQAVVCPQCTQQITRKTTIFMV